MEKRVKWVRWKGILQKLVGPIFTALDSMEMTFFYRTKPESSML